jgi:hypothetical protein
VARITARKAEFEAAGVGVASIGNGTALMARDFVAQFQVTIPVFTDPSRLVYQAAGLKRKFGLNLTMLGRAKDAWKDGFRQGRTQGDALQQGGVIVLDAVGRVVFHHVDEDAGDHAPMDDLLAAVRALGPA